MKLVSCGADGTLWAVNHERFTFRMDREHMKWEQMPGSFKQASSLHNSSCKRPNSNRHYVSAYTGVSWQSKARLGSGQQGLHLQVEEGNVAGTLCRH